VNKKVPKSKLFGEKKKIRDGKIALKVYDSDVENDE